VRFIALLVLGGCDPGPPLCPLIDGSAPDLSPEPPHTSALLELGGVEAMGQWVPLSDGQEVTLVEGAQGGFHVWLKYRVYQMGSGPQHLERTAQRAEDGQLVLRTNGSIMVGPNGPGQPWEAPDPLPMFMCPSPIGLSVIDRPIVFRLDFTDWVAKEITLVPHCPTDTSKDFCQRICTG
jgi:hypothetical protein